MGETAYDRVRKYVDYPYNQTPHLIHQSDLVDISLGDLRSLVDEIVALRAFRSHSDARFKDHGMTTLTARIFAYPGQYPDVSTSSLEEG